MKSVMLSIQPKWCEKIASGEKTIEVRKTKPKLETPFKVYIYCTKGKDLLREVDCWNTKAKIHTTNYKIINLDYCTNKIANGKVIGEFVCDKILCSQAYFDNQGKNHLTNVFEEDIKRTCLTEYELWDYIAGKAVKANEMYDGYLWHISELKIYDKPKELSEFRKQCEFAYSSYEEGTCYEDCIQGKLEDCRCFCLPLKRPPQSWCYVEDLGE